MTRPSASSRATAICSEYGFPLSYVQTGGSKPEVLALRWRVISTMAREGYSMATVAPIVGVSVRSCTNYIAGKVRAGRDEREEVRDIRDVRRRRVDPDLGGELKNERRQEWKVEKELS